MGSRRAVRVIRYAITSRHGFAGGEHERCERLLVSAVRLAEAGVDFLQVREKDLSFAEAASLAHQALFRIRAAGFAMQVLLNSEWPGTGEWPTDVGLHLSAASLAAHARLGLDGGLPLPALVSASCHTLQELHVAKQFATMVLFAPVFEKRVEGELVQEGRGLELLAEMCRAAAPLPVLAMGGVTARNAEACIAAGARGIAGIRLFQTEV